MPRDPPLAKHHRKLQINPYKDKVDSETSAQGMNTKHMDKTEPLA
jgi:hypothetical protein